VTKARTREVPRAANMVSHQFPERVPATNRGIGAIYHSVLHLSLVILAPLTTEKVHGRQKEGHAALLKSGTATFFDGFLRLPTATVPLLRALWPETSPAACDTWTVINSDHLGTWAPTVRNRPGRGPQLSTP
jgi:hypothetical protein